MFTTPRTGYRGLCLVIVTLVAGIHLAPAANRARGDDLAGFGCELAVAGDFMVVGAANEAGRGAAYVFRRSGDRWGLVQRLSPSQSSITGFAQSVAIDGKIVVAGNVLQDVGFVRSTGAAFVFEARGAEFPQMETQILSAPQPRRYSGFGEGVAVHGGLIAVGSPADGHGAVYLFRKKGNRWTNTGKLKGLDDPSDAAGEMFGHSVAMNDKFLVVIALMQRIPKQGRDGAIYIYRRADDGSVLEPPQMLTLPGQGVEEVASAVALRDTEVLVGAWGIDNGSKRDVGGAVLYTAGPDGKFAEKPAAVYIPLEAEDNERAGGAVALTADHVFVGSSGAANNKGCVYVFPRNTSDKEPVRRLEYPPAPAAGAAPVAGGNAAPGNPARGKPRMPRNAARRGKGAGADDGAAASPSDAAKAGAARDAAGGNQAGGATAGGNPAKGNQAGHFGGALAIAGEELLVGGHALDKEGRVVPHTLDKTGQWKPGDTLSPNSPPPQRGKKK